MENIEPQASLAGTKACPSSRVVLVVYFFDCCRVGCNPQRGVCCSHLVSLILQLPLSLLLSLSLLLLLLLFLLLVLLLLLLLLLLLYLPMLILLFWSPCCGDDIREKLVGSRHNWGRFRTCRRQA